MIEWSRVGIPVAPLRNLGKFVYPTLPVSFGAVGPFYLVSMRGVVKKSHTG